MYQWIYHWKITPQVLGLLQCRLRVVLHPYHSTNYLWCLCCSVIIITAVLCVWICILNRNCSIHRKAIYSIINTHIIYNISGAQTDICEVNLWFEATTCGDFGIVIQWMWHGDCFTNMILSFKCNKYHMLWTLTVLTHTWDWKTKKTIKTCYSTYIWKIQGKHHFHGYLIYMYGVDKTNKNQNNKEESDKQFLISGWWIQIQPLSVNMLTW